MSHAPQGRVSASGPAAPGVPFAVVAAAGATAAALLGVVRSIAAQGGGGGGSAPPARSLDDAFEGVAAEREAGGADSDVDELGEPNSPGGGAGQAAGSGSPTARERELEEEVAELSEALDEALGVVEALGNDDCFIVERHELIDLATKALEQGWAYRNRGAPPRELAGRLVDRALSAPRRESPGSSRGATPPTSRDASPSRWGNVDTPHLMARLRRVRSLSSPQPAGRMDTPVGSAPPLTPGESPVLSESPMSSIEIPSPLPPRPPADR